MWHERCSVLRLRATTASRVSSVSVGDAMKFLRMGSAKMEVLFVFGFVGAWLALQLWVLPRFGVET